MYIPRHLVREAEEQPLKEVAKATTTRARLLATIMILNLVTSENKYSADSESKHHSVCFI
jgi:hypothetical protein